MPSPPRRRRRPPTASPPPSSTPCRRRTRPSSSAPAAPPPAAWWPWPTSAAAATTPPSSPWPRTDTNHETHEKTRNKDGDRERRRFCLCFVSFRVFRGSLPLDRPAVVAGVQLGQAAGAV